MHALPRGQAGKCRRDRGGRRRRLLHALARGQAGKGRRSTGASAASNDMVWVKLWELSCMNVSEVELAECFPSAGWRPVTFANAA